MICLPLPLGQTDLFHLSETLPRNFISQLHASTVDALDESAMRIRRFWGAVLWSCLRLLPYNESKKVCEMCLFLPINREPSVSWLILKESGVYLISLWFLQSQSRLQTLFCLTGNNMKETVLWPCRKKTGSWQSQEASLMVMVQGNTIIDPSLNGDTKRNGRTFAKAQTWPS